MRARKDHCKLWTGKHNAQGYGVVRYKGKSYMAHRIMWQAFNGSIPSGMLVMHQCDTPACFNPNHLALGTYQDNNRDRMLKGRSASGEKSGRSKLTNDQVQMIRASYLVGSTTQTALAKQFGVSTHTVSMIVNYRIWRSI